MHKWRFRRTCYIKSVFSCYLTLRTLHLSLPLIKRNIPLDLLHTLQRLGIVPRRIFDFGLVGCDGVVGCVALVGAVRLGGCWREVGLRDTFWRKLWCCVSEK